MHKSSYLRMEWFVNTYLHSQAPQITVLDVGSQDVNGSYKPLFQEPHFRYTGLDMKAGANVDVVPAASYQWKELADGSYDAVISGQVFEHVEFFWITMGEIARVLRPQGLCCLVFSRMYGRRRYPVDCYRFDEDGMIALARYAGLEPLHVSTNLAPLGASSAWYSGTEDALLVARKPRHWTGMLDASRYTFKPADLAVLRTGFLGADEQPKPLPARSETAQRIASLVQTFAAESYLEIGVRDGATFFAVDMPRKAAVDPNFAFNPQDHAKEGVHFFAQPSDDFFAHLVRNPEEARALTVTAPDAPAAFDIIFIDGLHTFDQSLRDFENSLAFAHKNTIWILDDTVPCDPYSALPDMEKSLALRRQAGLHGGPWHGDVFKTVLAIHDKYPNISYCTLMGGNPQTVLWQAGNSGRKAVFSSLEAIGRLSYFDLLDHAALLLPVPDNQLLHLVGMTLDPILYGEAETWKKLLTKPVVSAKEHKAHAEAAKKLAAQKNQADLQRKADEAQKQLDDTRKKLEEAQRQ